MNQKDEEKLSKFMSKILRHDPLKFGLNLKEDGTCTIRELVDAINSQINWGGVTVENITQVVKNCSKQRYTINDGRIKANYGHSKTKITYQPKKPPEILYHGTNKKVEELILNEGIKPMGRNYVHLSEGVEFATLAGKRRGELVILKIDAKNAYENGVKFFYADNEVWLSDYISPKYIIKN
ncbi:RNA 2'-phosphotransferase [Gottfriedia sp. NPDC057991]|uniref:RNA 2'-phosphotransferase n=1 Tax=Gottfriedia sp. NPDC057991 TaxID=3346298 RepID=UPI0036DC010A